MSSNSKLKFQEYLNYFVSCNTIGHTTDRDAIGKQYYEILSMVFEEIIIKLSYEGMSLDSMTERIAAKALRHNNYSDVALGWCLNDAIKLSKQMIKENDNKVAKELKQLSENFKIKIDSSK